MIDHIFIMELDAGTVIVYINDILIPTDTKEEQVTIVKEVLKKIHDNDLFLKPEKCEFSVT